MQILIVDDNEEARIILKKILESNGHAVKDASNGKNALKAAKKSPPDMIISDILMPVMDGFQLCRSVREDPVLKHIPFVFYTATYTDERDEEFAFKIGADKFLRKPMEPDEFLKIITDVMRDIEEGDVQPRKLALLEEKEVFKLYNERLVNKLEKKMLDLEREVAERKRVEKRMAHLNNVLRAIRGVNQLIVKEKKHDRLIKGVCDNLTETRGYYSAWIALLDESGRLMKSAESGLGKDFEPMVKMLKGGGSTDCTRKALSLSGVIVVEDPLSMCIDCPLPSKYVGRGAMTIRLEHGGKAYGFLSVCVPRDFATEEEQGLFKEVAGDIAFALNSVELEEKRQQFEEMLRRGEEFNRRIIESSNDCIKTLDLDGRLEFMSEGGQKLLEIQDIGPYLNQSWIDFWKDSDRKAALEAISMAKEGGTGAFQGYSPTEKGAPKWWDVIITPITDKDGKTERLLAVSRDITGHRQAEDERKKLETQLQQSQKMEAIGTLAGGIAHDFNNILAIIIGYSELAKMKAPEGSEVMADLDEVLQAGNRAKALVKQILTVSRRHQQERQPLQLRYLVKEALKLLKATLPTTIEIREDLARDAGIVNADPNQIHQVLMNLCTNAGHAMEEDGGVLTVELGNVELDEFSASPYLDMDTGSYLRVTVSDTGHGMTPEIIEQIFDPYFTTKGIGEGTGLGLSVAHGIVKSHGGTIRVYSEPGKGSTFQVYLPIVGEAEKPRSESEGPVPTGTGRILFIDDEQTLANLGKKMLEHLGYEVVPMTSSLEALERFKAQPEKFDLVITDMTMPHMTGDRLAQELIEIRPDIPVILCTGFSKQISEEKAKEIGIRAFVMKPILKRTMAETVRNILDAGRSKV